MCPRPPRSGGQREPPGTLLAPVWASDLIHVHAIADREVLKLSYRPCTHLSKIGSTLDEMDEVKDTSVF